MIQIRIEVQEHKNGRISIESLIAVCKKTKSTKVEVQAADKLKEMVEIIITELAEFSYGSVIAKGKEDIETLKGLEDMDL